MTHKNSLNHPIGTQISEIHKVNDPGFSLLRFASRNSYFTMPAYIEGLKFETVFLVSSPNREDLIFVQDGEKLTCCNRLIHLSSNELSEISRLLFEETGAEIIVFEDLEAQDAARTKLHCLEFSFQENWKLSLYEGQKLQSSKQASNLRRKERRMQEAYPADGLHFRFEPATEKDVEAVVAMNRATLESQGRTHRFGKTHRGKFAKIARECGFMAGLYLGDRLISGNIITIVGNRSYFNVVGYELEFEKYSPGAQVHRRSLEECISRNCTEANFLWGNSRWKSDFGATRIPLKTVVIMKNRMGVVHPRLWFATKPYFESEFKKRILNLIR